MVVVGAGVVVVGRVGIVPAFGTGCAGVVVAGAGVVVVGCAGVLVAGRVGKVPALGTFLPSDVTFGNADPDVPVIALINFST